MEWSIHQLSRAAGTTSRTLRHYDRIGVVPATRTGANGYRYYDDAALVRLQRVLLLRELGLGLAQIAHVLEHQEDEAVALRTHLEWLRGERDRLERRIAAVTTTIEKREGGEHLMAHESFDGFDHTHYRAEVEHRWGADAYARSDAWWREMAEPERLEWQRASQALTAAWIEAAATGDPTGAPAQALAARHVAWLRGIPGTPAGDGGDVNAYVTALADMYVADPRFSRTYGGEAGARFVRDALQQWVRTDPAG